MLVGVVAALLVGQAGTASRPAPTVVQEIVFVRHAQTVANATSRYNTSTLNALSELGEKQVRDLTAQLKGQRFDGIYVSPAGRTLKTIAPYLRDNRVKGDIWPELYECCHERGEARKKPAGPLRYGSKIEPLRAIAPYFRLVPGRDRFIAVANYQEGMRQVRMCVAEVKKLTGRRILLVGHSLQGARLFTELLGRPNNREIKNALPIRLEKLSDGTYRFAK